MSTRVVTNTRLAVACQELARQQLRLPAAATLDLSGLRTGLGAVQRIDLAALGQLVSAAPVRMTLGTLARPHSGPPASCCRASGQASTWRRRPPRPGKPWGAPWSMASAAIGAATRDITAKPLPRPAWTWATPSRCARRRRDWAGAAPRARDRAGAGA